ncbi:hypothetical protein D9611_003448 [Ephemerocybe angulata]|uniref:ATP-dependent DNA helicase PIF1 n=1 Tax=Ephemerocybe angulata TaxID=980116 RepID=A0A8H5FHN3_9AGAR|nr:hypothetical protein D9611_003448 [Tulosesus angulatus]
MGVSLWRRHASDPDKFRLDCHGALGRIYPSNHQKLCGHMPKSKGPKFYAVLIGRGGPQVYTSWDEVSRYQGAVHKSFPTRKGAEEWLGRHPQSKTRQTISIPREIIVVSDSDDDEPPKQKKKKPEVIVIDSDSEDEPMPLVQPSPMNPVPPGKISTALAMSSMPPATAPPPVRPVLSPEQQAVLDKVIKGQSVFFTGSAGTGKSVLLREIIEQCGGRDSSIVAITATTGIASVNIGGCTIHSWAGVGLGADKVSSYTGKWLRNEQFLPIVRRWREVKTLIIDEISMLDGVLFDKLEAIARIMRRSELPFGGIQLVICGDFCQLPPISNKVNGIEIPAIFAFEASSWRQCVGHPTTLTKVFRQKDQAFVQILDEMRFGTLSPSTIATFKGLSRTVEYTDGIEPSELYSTRYEVLNANQARLNMLPGDSMKYFSDDRAGFNSEGKPIRADRMKQLLDKLVCQHYLELKVGAQVMLLKNLVQGKLVNGSIGKVVRFATLQEMNQEAKEAEKDKKKLPFQVDNNRLYPLVRFMNGIERLITPADFEITNAEDKMEARRIQVPLILAWALSIHKSQGQTLERVRVNLKRVFECGQAYVALSRATSLEHLQILEFDPGKVRVNQRVLDWYKGQEDDCSFDDDELDAIMASYSDY